MKLNWRAGDTLHLPQGHPLRKVRARTWSHICWLCAPRSQLAWTPGHISRETPHTSLFSLFRLPYTALLDSATALPHHCATSQLKTPSHCSMDMDTRDTGSQAPTSPCHLLFCPIPTVRSGSHVAIVQTKLPCQDCLHSCSSPSTYSLPLYLLR